MPKTPKSAKVASRRVETTFNPEQVLRYENGKLYLGGKEVPEGVLKNLQSDAHLLMQTTLWPILVDTTRAHLVKLGIQDSLNWDHVLVAKAGLTILDWQAGWLQAISKAKQTAS